MDNWTFCLMFNVLHQLKNFLLKEQCLVGFFFRNRELTQLLQSSIPSDWLSDSLSTL